MKLKQIVQGIAVGGTLVVSMTSPAQALDSLCSAPTAAASGTAPSGTTGFVKTSFTPKCSANVYLGGLDNTGSYSVKSSSKKGKTEFGGTTDAGTPTSCGTFTTAPTAVPTPSTTGC